MIFRSDVRNIGGRAQVVNLLNNHHSHLLNIKPTINTREPPTPHVSKGLRKKARVNYEDIIDDPNFVEVREAFKRVASLKRGGTDHGKPKTYAFGRKLSANKKKNNFEMNEHMKNLASLNRRINGIGCNTERKKNPLDPLAYPSLFFRRVGENDKTTSLDDYAKKISLTQASPIKIFDKQLASPLTKNTLSTSPNFKQTQSRPYSANVVNKYTSSKSGRPSTAKASGYGSKVQTIDSEQYNNPLLDFYIKPINDFPVIDENSLNPYLELKKELVEIIVAKRLYKDEDIQELFDLTVHHNPRLNRMKIMEICNGIKNDLDSDF